MTLMLRQPAQRAMLFCGRFNADVRSASILREAPLILERKGIVLG